MQKETPPWVSNDEAISGNGEMVPEIVEGHDKGKMKKVRLPKKGKDPTTPENFMQVMAHSATHGETSVPKVMEKVKDLSISENLLKKLNAPCPFIVQNAEEGIITSSAAIADILISKAIAGDMTAIREVLNRSEGKVPNVTHSESKSLKVSANANTLVALFDSLDKNK